MQQPTAKALASRELQSMQAYNQSAIQIQQMSSVDAGITTKADATRTVQVRKQSSQVS